MRKIKEGLSRDQALQVRAYLSLHGIETGDVEENSGDIWVLFDDHCPRARSLLEGFLENPIPVIPLVKVKKETPKRSFQRLPQQIWGLSPFSLGILLACCLSFLVVSFFPGGVILFHWLRFPQVLSLSQVPVTEYWRFITPIFLHAGIFHILFNMMWFYSFAPMVEERLSPLKHGILIVFVALLSHLAFFSFSGSAFLGYSGVVYGYVGFVWVYDRISPRRFLQGIDDRTARFFVIWHIFCLFLTGLHLNIANSIHGVGALAGMIFALLIEGHWRKITWKSVVSSYYVIGMILSLVVGGILVDYFAY